jgi:hypothetical protein
MYRMLVGKFQTKAGLARFWRKRVNNDDNSISVSILLFRSRHLQVLELVQNEILKRRKLISKQTYSLCTVMQTGFRYEAYEVLTAVLMTIPVSWLMTSCRLIYGTNFSKELGGSIFGVTQEANCKILYGYG